MYLKILKANKIINAIKKIVEHHFYYDFFFFILIDFLLFLPNL